MTSRLFAQTDTLFWFAAPEVTQGHSDRPIYLRLSTANKASSVVISQPANPSFVIKNIDIPANTTVSIDLTPSIDIIENKPANTVLNYGIKIKATDFISAYYEVKSSGLNPEIFSLKGKNALGTKFYIPAQNVWKNGPYTPTPYSGFQIVATEDNTAITILPKNNIVGHLAGALFIIILNKGQTWSGVATSQAANKHLGGTRIISTKPIAVTEYDDSVNDDVCYDLTGDQIVPVNIIGKKYIVPKGFLSSPINEKAVIVATQNNTSIYINGGTTPVATLNETGVFSYDITTPSVYIEANNPIYVMQYTGFGCELGGPVLPTIECTGSRQIGFTRSTSEFFGLMLIVRAGSEGHFLLNGDPTLIPSSIFSPVPGTNNQWLAGHIDFDTLKVPVEKASLITNTSDVFHMGIINGGSNSGCRYGYFSDFRTPPEPAVVNNNPCEGGSLYLSSTTYPNATYTWSGPNSYSSNEQNPVINNVTNTINAGIYSLIVNVSGCISLPVSTNITVYPNPPSPVISSNSPVYEGQSLLFHTDSLPNYNYLWSGPNGWSSTKINPVINNVTLSDSGNYSLKVAPFGCEKTSTINVKVLETVSLPIDLMTFKAICEDNKVTLYWVTTSEVNNNYFTIEKSTDNELWKVVGMVKGAGNSNRIINYTLVDKDAAGESLFYRLKQTDFNGKYKYSGMISSNCVSKEPSVSFLPDIDPKSNKLTVIMKNFDCKTANIILYDAMGKKVYERKLNDVSDNCKVMIDFDILSNGVYFIHFISKDFNKIQKMIKF
ncbi:MAG: T9SS type A sorting domain-containing protein [Bacteroidota bacterium]|nr:T9SS type A sorting domain-containing protein [Bacteroidota bacterium]